MASVGIAHWLAALYLMSAACSYGKQDEAMRADRATRLAIDLPGSLQNPCWSPSDARLALTRFTRGYNAGPSEIAVLDVPSGDVTILVDGADNVNLPGCWNRATDRIAYTSDVEDRDEVYSMRSDGSDRIRLTYRPGFQSFEATFSPDGTEIVFESHPEGVEEQGSIWKMNADGSNLRALTDDTGDDRQPNWSPRGDRVLFQSMRSGNLDIFTMNVDGSDPLNVTRSSADDTDASWSPDGSFIVYSSNEGGLDLANIFIIPAEGGTPMRLTMSAAYDGAPAWSPSGGNIAFESFPGEPDDSPGTEVFVISVLREL